MTDPMARTAKTPMMIGRDASGSNARAAVVSVVVARGCVISILQVLSSNSLEE